MRVIDLRESVDPFYNLALEEHLFKNVEDAILMFWQSENAIVVGKHQNAYREINLDYVNQHKIDIARRLSGGGAVYHDLGNLNFTFIQNGEKNRLVDFAKFLDPIIRGLNAFGLETYQGKRNEIMLKGMKISGNAEHTFKSRVLHHGTLLFDSNLETLVKSLRINPFKYKDKAIKSVQSRVTNISNHLAEKITLNAFREQLLQNVMNLMPEANPYQLTTDDKEKTNKLLLEKYSTWVWNFGYSPNYELDKTIQFNETETRISLQVKKGTIQEIHSDNLELNKHIKKLIGLEHKAIIIDNLLKEKRLNLTSQAFF